MGLSFFLGFISERGIFKFPLFFIGCHEEAVNAAQYLFDRSEIIL